MPELIRFESTKSMMRYLPPNGTAGFERSAVSGSSRVPLPPAMTNARILLRMEFLAATGRLSAGTVEGGSEHAKHQRGHACTWSQDRSCIRLRDLRRFPAGGAHRAGGGRRAPGRLRQ